MKKKKQEALTVCNPLHTTALTAISQKLTRKYDDDETLLTGLSQEKAKDFSDGDLFQAIRLNTDAIHAIGERFFLSNDDRAILYDEMISRYKSQHLAGDQREGRPTVGQAFKLAGWDYGCARVWKSRWEAQRKKFQAKLDGAKPKPLTTVVGDKLLLTDGAPLDIAVPSKVELRVKEVSTGGQHTTIEVDDTTTESGVKEFTVPLRDADGVDIFKKTPSPIKTIVQFGLYRFASDPYGVVYECTDTATFEKRDDLPSQAQLDDAMAAAKKAAKNVPVTRTDATPPTSPSGEAKPKVQKKKTAWVSCKKCGLLPSCTGAETFCQCPPPEKKVAKARPVKAKKTTAVELIVRELGGKFFLFAKNGTDSADHTITGAKSSEYDTKAEAEAVALKLNIKYGFATPMDALVFKAKTEGSITTNDYYDALAATV